jgi:hypothetical protein
MSDQLNELKCLAALGSYFDYRQNRIFPNVLMYDWEADLVSISKSDFLTEIEVKVTTADWKADIKKDKWKSRYWPNVSRFYYAVPQDLLPHEVQGEEHNWWDAKPHMQPKINYTIPGFVPAWAGVLVLTEAKGKIHVHELREAKRLGKLKIGPNVMQKLYNSTYYRYWQSGVHRPHELGCEDCRVQSIAGADE